MASDSRSTYSDTGHFTDSTYKAFVTSNNVGISTCGVADINGRSLARYIEEFIRINGNLDVTSIANEIKK